MAEPEEAGTCLRTDDAGEGIVRLTMSRPERLNALSAGLVDELHAAFDALAGRADVRAVVLTGAGRGFCAGLDLTDHAPAASPQARLALQERIAGLVLKMRELPQVVVAAVNGPAAGGGLALALGADVRYAAASASFGVSFVRIGLSGADIGVSWLLPRLVGASAAFELMLSGRMAGSDHALRIGLVSAVTADGEAVAEAEAFAREVLANSPMGVRMTKQVMWSQLEVGSLRAGVDLENRTQIMTSFTDDHAEAVRAWLDRRPARFRDR
ncbi:enoyl-CoA hydratase/isomerase family protein [Actinomadura algeriensis]|uniref:Enoyl-CoA hydratase n=1 Tax=Actinomadura algeriensis TaxID=1679523 RepID=A0ABR9K0K2_9ACTN|nr:enoyl-CoA hydratase/isomerase family protein [Actinomadura algeriensis]MBE1535890.1 enoyl-CoA hydratase [Actinomadura algeriensis]